MCSTQTRDRWPPLTRSSPVSAPPPSAPVSVCWSPRGPGLCQPGSVRQTPLHPWPGSAEPRRCSGEAQGLALQRRPPRRFGPAGVARCSFACFSFSAAGARVVNPLPRTVFRSFFRLFSVCFPFVFRLFSVRFPFSLSSACPLCRASVFCYLCYLCLFCLVGRLCLLRQLFLFTLM